MTNSKHSTGTAAGKSRIIEESAEPISSIGSYTLLEKIASGGTSDVYMACARDEPSKRVAVKILRASLGASPVTQRLLGNEATIASSIWHKNVCRVLGHGHDKGRFFLVMDYIDGVSMAKLLKILFRTRGRLRVQHAVALFEQACAGVAELHSFGLEPPEGIVHGDIAPDNLLVTRDGEIKVCDFGISSLLPQIASPATSSIEGKLRYMSPEQARGEALTTQSDVFSLGIVLFELLACRPLFLRPTDAQTHQAVLHERIPSIHGYRGVPEDIAGVLGRALQRDPSRRYASAREFHAAVVRASRELGQLPEERELAVLVNELSRLPETESDAAAPRRARNATAVRKHELFPRGLAGADQSGEWSRSLTRA